MDYERWINAAISKTGALSPGTIFVLKDLFSNVDWNTVPAGERRIFGRKFKAKVTSGLVPDVEYLEKAQNNSALYIKRGAF